MSYLRGLIINALFLKACHVSAIILIYILFLKGLISKKSYSSFRLPVVIVGNHRSTTTFSLISELKKLSSS